MEPSSALSAIELFADLNPEDRADIERSCRARRYGAHEQIIDRDSPSTEVLFVVEGRVRVVNYSVSGREITFDELPAGTYFGEIAAIDGQPRSASVMALDNALVLSLPRAVFLDALDRHPVIAHRVMRRLARIVRTADERIMDLSTLAAQNRVHAEVLRQARAHMIGENTARIKPIPVHSDIASRVSTTRETVARVLNELAREGVVRRTKDALEIQDVEHLESIVEEVRG